MGKQGSKLGLGFGIISDTHRYTQRHRHTHTQRHPHTHPHTQKMINNKNLNLLNVGAHKRIRRGFS